MISNNESRKSKEWETDANNFLTWPEVREQLQQVVDAIDEAVPGSYCEIARVGNKPTTAEQ